MRLWSIATGLCLSVCSVAWASYTYYFTDTLTSVNTTNWTQNGSVTAGSSGLTSSSSGALISKVAVPNGATIYEIRTILNLTTNGGNFFAYLRASSNTIAGSSGTFYGTEISNPTFSGGTCTATASILKSINGTITTLSSTTIYCHSGMEVRTLETVYNGIMLYVDGYLSIDAWDSAITTGQPGIGVSSAPAGNTISLVQLGPITHTAPTVNAQLVGSSAFPNQVNLEWSGAFTPDPNGTGIAFYYIVRNGTDRYFFNSNSESQLAFSDDTVTASTQYSYQVQAYDYDWNEATATVTIPTPSTGSIDARRVGVRSLGSYWGDAGEQIDTLSGNLNFTIPLLTAMGRGGWSAGFGLNYNSQVWRQDSGGTWQLGRDIGYGYGWKLQAGSLTPSYKDNWTVDHYVFIDTTGAEYRLDQYNSANCMWTSLQGVYVGYNPCVNRLFFPDGSFWIMGATSGGLEQDAGTLYPTQMEDSNGNQVFLAYQYGVSALWANSSSRITSIEDVRAQYTGSGPSGYQTYSFTYNTDAIPHLTNITSHITGVGNWTLAYVSGQALNSPFSPSVAFGTATMLTSAQRDSDGQPPYQFQYASSGSGELTQVTTNYGGALGWAYRPFTYSGSRTYREVQYRYLTMQSGRTQYTYTFTRNDTADIGLTIHSGVTLDDPSGTGEKVWTFITSGSASLLGLAGSYEARPSAAHASTPLQHKDFTWVQDSAGTPYIGTVVTTLDPTGANVQTKTTQTLDTHGNVTQTAIYDYYSPGNPPATATRTYNYTYGYSFYGYGFTTYRMTQATVSNSSQTVTLITNSYDSTGLANVTGVREHDSSYGTGVTARGNLSATTPLGGPTTTINRDITGNVVSTNDGLGHTISVTTSTATNYTAPDVITPNGNTNLNQSMTYAQSLAVNSITGPNSAVASATYDAWNRPTSTTSVYGAVTNYSYSNTTYGAFIQGTTNSRWEQHYLDGFGRTTTFNRGYGSTFVSTIQTVYGPCACSPLGKMTQISEPYVAGGGNYATYTYDGLGRTVKVVAADGASTTTYSYAGNVTTITDPAGKWKKRTTDAMGNLKQVNEPNPAGGADYVTTYTYDMMNRLTQVSMPRPSGTQTRTFVYDATTQRLNSETHPESGQKTYTYNTDGTLASRTDARSQVAKYTYDAYQRVTMVQYFPNPASPTTEDMCQRRTLTYDTTTIDPSQQNTWGRATSVQWGAVGCQSARGDVWAYWYSYTPAGLISSKGINLARNSSRSGYPVSLYGFSLVGTYTYDNEGRQASVTYPTWYTMDTYDNPVAHAGITYTYAFDSMGRPSGLTDNDSTPITWIQNAVYNAADQITALPRKTGIANYTNETRQYNSLLQMTRMTFGSLDMEYIYSPTANNGRITQSVEHISNQVINYTYDSLSRLATAQAGASSFAGAWSEGYAYDGFGNLTDKNVTGGTAPSLHVTVDAATNHLTGTYAYDLNGNLTNIPSQAGISYDAENRVSATSSVSGGAEQYANGPDNQRIWKLKADGTEEMYYYDLQGHLLGTYPIYPNPLNAQNGYYLFYIGQGNTNVWFAGRMISVGTMQDQLGSIGHYYPYGEAYAGSAPIAFATYYRDASTLDYAQNRYYASSLARFTSPDPYMNSGGPADPGSWNRYAYTVGDPINRLDPTGLCYVDAPPEHEGETCAWMPSGGDLTPKRPKSHSDQPSRGGGSSLIGLLSQSIARLLKAMTEACAEAIGAKNLDDALKRLQKINIGFSDQGELKVETDAHGNITGVPPGQELAHYFGGIFGIGKNIKLNNEVNWFDPNNTPALDQNAKQVTYPLLTAEAFQLGIPSMNAGQFMDLTVLHELAHSFGQDHPKNGSDSYDNNIWSHCFK